MELSFNCFWQNDTRNALIPTTKLSFHDKNMSHKLSPLHYIRVCLETHPSFQWVSLELFGADQGYPCRNHTLTLGMDVVLKNARKSTQIHDGMWVIKQKIFPRPSFLQINLCNRGGVENFDDWCFVAVLTTCWLGKVIKPPGNVN